ncbi:hypothetical protein DIS24_g2760 [Lasiodiplodia hormozganensis]|uniref:Concanavalin A-like lectin/glucanase n=1 Tax=Lasiodiplodia hormozganensis TaxID=869390 RepID=A0AA40D5W8_9PEZI|nr:hypothetical protein DIS24_g2760 [Lasiodiplodia hormozganensis]
MRSTLSLPLLALALRARAGEFDAWKFGNMFALGPTSGDAYITKATWSVVPPSVPCGAKMENPNDPPFMSIWIGVTQTFTEPGMDLFQPLLNWSPDQESQVCAGSETEWCVAASTFTPNGQVQQAYEVVPDQAQLDFEIDVDDSHTVSQKVFNNGKLVSQQSDRDANGKPPVILYSANECYLGTCGTLDGYTWDNVTIVLSTADKSFGDTLSLTGASGSFTTDDGKTWHTDSIKINKDYFYADGSKTECSA